MIASELIHPIIVHFPIVFFLTLAAFDGVAAVRGVEITGRTSAGNVSTGLAVLAGLAAVAAMVFGKLALGIAESHGFHSEVAEIHEGLGEFTAASFALWALVRGFLWQRDIRPAGFSAAAVPIVEVVGGALVVATAYYGGALVFDLGVNVAHAANR